MALRMLSEISPAPARLFIGAESLMAFKQTPIVVPL